jgi:hypothetical protein
LSKIATGELRPNGEKKVRIGSVQKPEAALLQRNEARRLSRAINALGAAKGN